ncbi:four helix bundle protein [Empedobacter brevis]|uniref:Four helix bundle protein n=1 Tax=Empedobacter brevis TaxID=247 RepID=A0AAJ1QHI2_9FLAO|nr:four helix bundle protein [Empedobacter brevis]MDM1074051.1 four helix bundle protein [Empedobacter brevis]QHC86471.1 four helix bundle protein [Empedobacter brevis]
MNNYKDLLVWQKSIDYTLLVYSILKSFPKEEIYSLTSQIKRSLISIPSNIAEGAGRNSKKEFNQFLSIALASSFELETQLIIALKLSYIENDECLKELNHIQNMIAKLKKSLNT